MRLLYIEESRVEKLEWEHEERNDDFVIISYSTFGVRFFVLTAISRGGEGGGGISGKNVGGIAYSTARQKTAFREER